MDKATAEKLDLVMPVQGEPQRLTSLSVGLLLFTPIPFKDTAAAFKGLLDEYLQVVPKARFRWQNLGGSSASFKPLAPRAFATIDAWLTLQRGYGQACSVWLKDGATVTDVGDNLFNLWGADRAKRPSDSNYLRILFPWTVVEGETREAFLAAVHGMLQNVPFHSGYLGYVLNVSTLATVAPYSAAINTAAFAAAQRYVGLEVAKPHLENYEMNIALRPPSWVTFLSPPFLERLGGVDQLRAELKGDFRFRQLAHGWSIQAGAEPRLGDRNRGQDVSPGQRELARVFSPCYSDKPAYLFADQPHGATVDWMRRLTK
jgi:hypothetical protein